MTLRLSAQEFKAQFGSAFPNHTTQAKQSPAIRLPKKRQPNKGEQQYGELLKREFPRAPIFYEAIKLNMPSGTIYTADWAVFTSDGWLLVEVKGSYRLGSAAASAKAFKEAVSTFFPHIKFRHATKSKDASGWSVTEPKQ